MKNYQVTIEFSSTTECFFLEIQAQDVRPAIENAVKQMTEAYPYFAEGKDYSIAEVKLVEHFEHFECGVWHK